MTRLAFLRSIEIQQTRPYLGMLRYRFTREGIVARLFHTEGDCGPEDFPGSAERVDPGVTPDVLARQVLAWRPDAVVSLSIPDENALRDAAVKERLERQGVPVVMHGLDTVNLLSNKWETKRVIAEHGLAQPDAVLLDGDLLNGRGLPVPAFRDVVLHQAQSLGYPLITKPLWDCLGNGMHVLADEDELSDYLRQPYNGNLMLERFTRGELCSVEVVGARGHYVVQPVIWMGPADDGPSSTFQRLRYVAPRPEADAAFAPVAQRLVRLCRSLDIEGALDMDMIYVDGEFHVLEINPRVSGATTLAIAGSGLNTYDCLVSMACGQWPHRLPAAAGQARMIALQFPLCSCGEDTDRLLADTLDLVRTATYHIDGVSVPNAVVTCAYDDALRLPPRLRELVGAGCLDALTAHQIESVVTTAGRLPVPATPAAG
ncbi:ATP-grasp domain-containing protein [Streptomyces sp. NRRL F-5126]|uniref:ATP-grasp domain-containing protein n=1 Tax=Streptomyces sp. NRRL F-5126 TaxID=1463857 RepID=UPI00068E6C20|nr:ATP-grasp domain-containing protein [Streptomyces sp. NRRL F-5126]